MPLKNLLIHYEMTGLVSSLCISIILFLYICWHIGVICNLSADSCETTKLYKSASSMWLCWQSTRKCWGVVLELTRTLASNWPIGYASPWGYSSFSVFENKWRLWSFGKSILTKKNLTSVLPWLLELVTVWGEGGKRALLLRHQWKFWMVQSVMEGTFKLCSFTTIQVLVLFFSFFFLPDSLLPFNCKKTGNIM